MSREKQIEFLQTHLVEVEAKIVRLQENVKNIRKRIKHLRKLEMIEQKTSPSIEG